MCDQCTTNFAALTEEQRAALARHVRHVQSSIVSALRDAGENAVMVYAACAFIAEYHRRQMDGAVLAIADDMVARNMKAFEASLAERGVTLGPAKHDPMTFGPAPSAPREGGDDKTVDLTDVPEQAREAVATLIERAAAAGIPVTIVKQPVGPVVAAVGPRDVAGRAAPERPLFVRRAPRRGRPS